VVDYYLNNIMEHRAVTRSMFVESHKGNIKEKYFFEKKLGSGGYGAVYLAKNKVTGKLNLVLLKCSNRWESCNKGDAKKQDIRLWFISEWNQHIEKFRPS